MIEIKDIEIYSSKKIVDYNTASKMIKYLKEDNKLVGLCHGSFDLMHPGHINHLESAKSLCDVLFVSITSDRFVELMKGPRRPIFPERLRAYMIAGIEYVDNVVISDSESSEEILKILRPCLYIKGPDYIDRMDPNNPGRYDPRLIAEVSAVRKFGGDIAFTQDSKLSTTEIISYIKKYF